MPEGYLIAIIGTLFTLLTTIVGFFIVRSLSKVDSYEEPIKDLQVSLSALDANMETVYARLVEMTEQAKQIEHDIKDLAKLETQVALLKEAASRVNDMKTDVDNIEKMLLDLKGRFAICESACPKKR